MAKHKIKHNVVFLSDKDGITHAHYRGSEVDLTAEQAERLEKLGAIETNDDRASGEDRTPRGRRTATQAASEKVEADKAEAGKE